MTVDQSQSHVLFQTVDQSITILDIPRSIEQSQVPPGANTHRFLLARPGERPPPQVPYDYSPDGAKQPSTGGGEGGRGRTLAPATISGSRNNNVPPPAAAHVIADLMTAELCRSALQLVKTQYSGPWCLPRRPAVPSSKSDATNSATITSTSTPPSTILHSRPHEKDEHEKDENEVKQPIIPQSSNAVQGHIVVTLSHFLSPSTPQFSLILLDPPWPNRSAKRKRKATSSSIHRYTTQSSLTRSRRLLSKIPISSLLAPDGLVGIWVTNSPGAHNLLKMNGGIIQDDWRLEVVAEWTWLKVTIAGDPIFALTSEHRKPWEKLLVARRLKRADSSTSKPLPVRNKIIIAVPDVHSRKPNLRQLFEPFLGRGYRGLEIFARNLTSGWWAWGDQVLMFQAQRYWTEEKKGQGGEETIDDAGTKVPL